MVDVPLGNPLSMRQLLYFVVVADELNFTRAARRLNISTPALSQQVKALERSLGVQLLVRDTRRVQLTAAGRSLARAGERLLRDAASAVETARNDAGLVNGHLTLAALHEADTAFETFLTDFHATHPGIQVDIATMRHQELVTAVRSRTADAGLTWSFLLERAGGADVLRWLPAVRTEVFAAVDPEHELAQAEAVPRGPILRRTPAVLFERAYSPVTYDYAVEQLFGPDCDDPPVHEIQVTVRAQEAMARHIADTGALAPLSKPVADLLRDTWTVRPFSPPWLLDGCVVHLPDLNSAALAAFIAFIRGGHGPMHEESADRDHARATRGGSGVPR